MVNFLRRVFIKDYQNIDNPTIRQKHGILACIVGIISNLTLFFLKLIVGILAGSISIISDGMNNLSDMGSSFITLFGFRMANKPADKEHPFGHERSEYVSGLIVSIVIIIVGVQLIIESSTKFYSSLTNFTPEKFSLVTFIILGISIVMKLLQGLFYRRMGKIIQSVSLEATAADSINDVIATTTILIGTIICYFWPEIKIGDYFISIDSIMGIGVAIFVIVSGIKLIKETINPLIGTSADPAFVKEVVEDIKKYEGVLGVHDVICHTYGPNTYFMSLHVEVDYRKDIIDSHELVDEIEKEIGQKYRMMLVIHMDPVDVTSPEVVKYKELIQSSLNKISPELSFHDFRIVNASSFVNVIFDCVLPFEFTLSKEDVLDKLKVELADQNPTINLIVNFDVEYVVKE